MLRRKEEVGEKRKRRVGEINVEKEKKRGLRIT